MSTTSAATAATVAAETTLNAAAIALPRRRCCPACAYDLSDTLSRRLRTCPECGGAFELHDLVEARSIAQRFRRSTGFILLLTAALVIVADIFFFSQPVGCTIGLFIALLTVGVIARDHAFVRAWPGRPALAALALIVFALLEHPGPLRAIVALAGLVVIASLNRQRWTTSVTAWASRGCEAVARCFAQLPRDIVIINRWTKKHGGRAARSMRSIANWGIPILLSLVFIGLFAVANPVIEQWLQRIGESASRIIQNASSLFRVDRIVLWLLFALVSWSLVRGRFRWKLSRAGVKQALADAPAQTIAPSGADRSALLVRCLILFNIVFIVQLAVDVATALSSGATLPEGMSYGTYARRGAYPLVATALLAAAFVLITFPSGRDAKAVTRQSPAMRWARWLVYLWIAQNIVLTLSAVWRLEIYVAAFSLTRLRVAAAIWMLLVAFGLVTIVWRIVQHRTNAWLLRINALSLVVVLYTCCFVNFDSMIAWYDVKHCAENGVEGGPHVDRAYLRSLGPEAIAPLQWLADRTHDGFVASRLRQDVAYLTTELDDKLASWQGWTFRRASIARKLRE